jgi:hypothetical protein
MQDFSKFTFTRRRSGICLENFKSGNYYSSHNIVLWEKTGENPIDLQIKKTKMEVDRAHY